jgi:hypothetical protein
MQSKLSARQKIVYIAVFFTAIFSIFFYSCKKTDFIQNAEPQSSIHDAHFKEQFFKTTSKDLRILDIINKLKAEDDRTGFVDKLPANCGYPIWTKLILTKKEPVTTLVSDDNASNTIIIPLSNTNENLSSIIAAKPVDGGFDIDCRTPENLYTETHTHIFDSAAVANDLNMFFYMENRAFGTTKFYHIPVNFFKQSKTIDTDGNKTIEIARITDTSITAPLWICIENRHCVQTAPCSLAWCDECFLCKDVECVIIIPPPPHYPSNPPSGPAGGGSSGGGGNNPTGGPAVPVGCETCTPHCTEPFYLIANPCSTTCTPDQSYNGGCLTVLNYPGKDYNYPYQWWNDELWIQANMYQFASNAHDPSLNNPIVYNFTNSSPSIDLQKYINCFNAVPDAGSTCTIKLCADIPVNNLPGQLITSGYEPGHAFITMTKTNGSQTVTQSFGFYPQGGFKSIFFAGTASKIVDDGKQGSLHEYNASISMNVSTIDFNGTLSLALSKSTLLYDLNDNNCTDFALDLFNSNRYGNPNPIIVPDWTYSYGPAGHTNYGTTPNGLYKKLQEMKSANGSESGNIQIGTFNASASHGPCP